MTQSRSVIKAYKTVWISLFTMRQFPSPGNTVTKGKLKVKGTDETTLDAIKTLWPWPLGHDNDWIPDGA